MRFGDPAIEIPDAVPFLRAKRHRRAVLRHLKIAGEISRPIRHRVLKGLHFHGRQRQIAVQINTKISGQQ